MSNPSQPTPGDEAARVAHQFPKGFVDAAFAAREKGLRAICFTCYTGFNEPECPVCHPVAAPPGGPPPVVVSVVGECPHAVTGLHSFVKDVCVICSTSRAAPSGGATPPSEGVDDE